jgi:hypothetical protein
LAGSGIGKFVVSGEDILVMGAFQVDQLQAVLADVAAMDERVLDVRQSHQGDTRVAPCAAQALNVQSLDLAGVERRGLGGIDREAGDTDVAGSGAEDAGARLPGVDVSKADSLDRPFGQALDVGDAGCGADL